MIEAIIMGSDGSNEAATNPEMMGGIIIASAFMLPLIPSISPCIAGPAERESSEVRLACESPIAIAKNGTIKYSHSERGENNIKRMVIPTRMREFWIMVTSLYF